MDDKVKELAEILHLLSTTKDAALQTDCRVALDWLMPHYPYGQAKAAIARVRKAIKDSK